MSGSSVPASFSAWFLKENFLLYSINWPNFIVWLLLLREIVDNIYIYIHIYIYIYIHNTHIYIYIYKILFLTRFWRRKFCINQSYISNEAVFATWQKSQDKNLNSLRTKRAFKMKKKYFASLLKGFHCSKWSWSWEFDFHGENGNFVNNYFLGKPL